MGYFFIALIIILSIIFWNWGMKDIKRKYGMHDQPWRALWCLLWLIIMVGGIMLIGFLVIGW